MVDFREYDKGPLGERVGPQGIQLRKVSIPGYCFIPKETFIPMYFCTFDSSCAHGMITILKASVAMLGPNIAQQNSHERLSSVSERWVV